MRLIDADALIEDLKKDVESNEKILCSMDYGGGDRELIQFDKDCKQNAIYFLLDAPTIEPERSSDCISRQSAIDAISDCGICLQKIYDLPHIVPKFKYRTLKED